MKLLLSLVTLQVLFIGCCSYPLYQTYIPNGDKVQVNCTTPVGGVGHVNPLGSGARNSFGQLFEKYHTWNMAVCSADSDGDGRTNGEELGDPLCKWKMGDSPARTTGITHPGVPDNTKACLGNLG